MNKLLKVLVVASKLCLARKSRHLGLATPDNMIKGKKQGPRGPLFLMSQPAVRPDTISKPQPKVLTVIGILFLAGTVSAHEFIAPASVTANGDGFFSYEVTVVITSPVEFAYVDVDGSDNTDIGHFHGDGFCTTVIDPGVYTTPVEGSLLDPYVDGSVTYVHAMCDGWTGMGTTIIQAPAVAIMSVSWSSLKARYR
jgi:hypothetical protein